jgi:hypothetical protein
MDIYNGPVGLANQIHDYSPGIPPSGLFWLVSAPHDAVQVHLGSGTASVHMTDVPVLDAHDIKNALTGGPTVDATVSFDIEWSNVLEQAKVTNDMQRFTGQFWKTGATINWSSQNLDGSGFSFHSEAPDPSRNVYSVIGHEHSGVFFH